MLFEALIYFLDYRSIAQIDVELKELSIEINYCNDMLFHFLDNNLNLNICKSWVKYLDDKSLLTLYLVKYSRDSEWVKLLLTFHPEVDYRCGFNELLISCCKYGHLEIVKWLVDNGTNIRVNDWQPFQYACASGHLETAKYLLSLINADDEKKLYVQSDNDCALIWSAGSGHLEVVKWLVTNGSNIRVNNYQPFQYACQEGQLEIAKYLLSLIDTDKEKKLCIRSNEDYALGYSASDAHLEVVKWLINNGANFRNYNYKPFRYACEGGHLETAKYLLSLIDTDEEKKLCIHSNDIYALRFSARYGHLEVVKWLVSNEENVRIQNYRALQCACESGQVETAQYLLSLIDTDEEKKTCVYSNDSYVLRFSVEKGYLKIVKCLIDSGANIAVDYYQVVRSVEERVKIIDVLN